MSAQYAIVPFVAQAERPKQTTERQAPAMSEGFGERLLEFLGPLVQHLHEVNKVDKRPLKTLVQTVEAILAFRDRCNGLLFSELGGYLDQLGDGGGGVKRLETLIHHPKWKAEEIEEFLLWRADQQLAHWEAQGEEGLFIWDGVGLEKPESLKGEGLCPTRSGKAARLTHVKQGYYRPPSAPIFVPGLHGIGGLLAGRKKRQGPVMLSVLRWWSSRGAWASFEKDENCKLLRQLSERWGRRLVHVFDRGYCGGPWLGALRCFNIRFIVRFKHRYHLLDSQGEKRAAWKIARGKVGQAPRTIYDAVHRCHVQGSVLAFQVTHPDFPDWPLTLVVGRRKGLEPIYLLTNEEVNTAEDAWKVVLAYIRRWRIEMAFRHLKSDMGIQSLRVYAWEDRLKLLGLLTLAYGFLMDLMAESLRKARDWLLDFACHRRGQRLREVEVPLSRLRLALSKLWLAFPCWFVRRGRFLL
jgi:Transposase DDE domain